MSIKLALAGDTMLGRGVAQSLLRAPPGTLFSSAVAEAIREADLFVLNLECCISERGAPWPDPSKPFFFRAPPSAVDALAHLGVDCVTLANNHALDFGETALSDTLGYLEEAGIRTVGAGPHVVAARAPAILVRDGFRLAVLGVTDHPSDYAAGPTRAGVAFADLRRGPSPWLGEAIRSARVRADAVLVTPHWGPNMTTEPVPHVSAAARYLVEAGATLVAGHSAHVFHGVSDRVLFDIGDFLDDYLTDPVLRNDLGLLFLVTLDGSHLVRLEAVPLKLDFCHTRLAGGEDGAWVRRRFREACGSLGTEVTEEGGRLVVSMR